MRRALMLGALLWAAGLVISMCLLRPGGSLELDLVAVNRIAHIARENWGALEGASFGGAPYDFSILDTEGRLLYSAGEAAHASALDAARNNGFIMELGSPEEPLGTLLISTGVAARVRAASFGVFGAFAALGLLGGGYFLFLYKRVADPFQRLGRFAARVASGNLEAPLQMDRGNLFGAFTESFDLMREELRRARARDLAAQQEKKELIASLSHDIRTPVTSIKLQCEVLEVSAPPEYAGKLKIIRQRADRIDNLITNLFQATLEELGELRVQPLEIESAALAGMLRDADTSGLLMPFTAPGCILRVDPLRMEQVIDNILYNSYKYAGTPVRAHFSLTDEFLEAGFYDTGPGVPGEEVSHLCEKFYRGGNAADKDGSGLGLYLCGYLMEKMGGDIQCGNWEKGFVAKLLIPLA